MQKPRIVLKVGSSNLCNGKVIDKTQIQALAKIISELKTQYDVILVSSGAVASGHTALHIDKNILQNRQALASIGQPLLMESYRNAFEQYNITIAQLLLVWRDFDSRRHTDYARNTIDTLLAHNVLPIINANDGYFDKNPHHHSDAKILPIVHTIAPSALEESHTPNENFATGGIVTKLLAANFLLQHREMMFLSHGRKLNVLRDFLLHKKHTSGTLFCPADSKDIEALI